MRTIKFRAWDTIANQFAPLSNKFINLETGILFENCRDGFEGQDELKASRRFMLMQFTGLLDKNGKEIYEGDVVKISHTNKQPLGLGKDGEVCQIIWDSRYTGFGLWHSDLEELESLGNYSRNPTYNKVEVIGNIYENPELNVI